MTPSTDTASVAQKLLDEAVQLQDEDLQYRLIDDPIDRLAQGFQSPVDEAVTHRGFHLTVAELVRHLYRGWEGIGRDLSPSQASDEAMFLLQHAYQGTLDNGYDAARCDAQIVPNGQQILIHQFVESFKAWRRGLHLQWVQTRVVGTQPWEIRRQIAAILLNRLDPYLPDSIRSRSPASFAADPLRLLGFIGETSPAATIATASPAR